MSFVLNRPMKLQSASRLPDGAGGYAETWVPLGVLWCAVRPGAGSAGGADFVATSEVPVRIVVRAMPVGSLSRPRPDQRLVEGARRFRILAVTEADAAGRYLTCFAREEAAT